MKVHYMRNFFDKVTGITSHVAGLKKVACFMLLIFRRLVSLLPIPFDES
jgi:hypothetical protein